MPFSPNSHFFGSPLVGSIFTVPDLAALSAFGRDQRSRARRLGEALLGVVPEDNAQSQPRQQEVVGRQEVVVVGAWWWCAFRVVWGGGSGGGLLWSVLGPLPGTTVFD